MNLGSRPASSRTLTFSFARAIQHPALEIWHGQPSNVPLVQRAQRALSHRAARNCAAVRDGYTAEMAQSGAPA